MPDSTPPTSAELWRRLDDVVKRFEDVSKDVREFRNWAERLYVPRGEWVEGRRADQALTKDVADDITELKKRDEANTAYRRQMTVALITVALGALATLLISLINLTHGGTP